MKTQAMKIFFLQYFNRIAFILLALTGLNSCDKTTTTIKNINKIQWVNSLDSAMTLAKTQHKPMMVDFWADWCVACKELDETTYANTEVIEIINKSIIAVKLDHSDLTDEKKKILEKYGIVGLPAVIFLDKSGKVISDISFSGYIDEKKMLSTLKKLKSLVDHSGQCKTC